ncbi:2-C-methyl-D-erythritol 2,4-cyclodiphosphate synthase [Candidatus Sumerlaeota bacterium]|nr:2-C-methyl-D-erythritol 2,4-cyclodiphosphate synthase [Candidatus Sumerlaeota bacterium]
MRIGIGIDIHPFAEGRELVLGGVKVPYSRGLSGHSDADALTHAICDAILGAMGEGDIGTHFPDTDPQYKNISSLVLLAEVVRMMNSKNFRIVNVDATVVCEAPGLAPFIPQMKESLLSVLGLECAINIKATRGEGLGFIGRGEGIVCLATVLVEEQ